jgi:hypothetical protein
MQLGHQLKDQVRTLFHIRSVRQVGPVGPKPRIGAVIFRGEVRITVQAGLTDDLWAWLAQHGWREPIVWPDRRRYRDVPASLVTRLFDASPEEWMRVLTVAVSRATNRPTLDPAHTINRSIPASVMRK